MAPSKRLPGHAQVQEVCVLVALRSAKMVAAGLDGLLTHSGWKRNTLRDLARLCAATDGHKRGSLEPVSDWHSGTGIVTRVLQRCHVAGNEEACLMRSTLPPKASGIYRFDAGPLNSNAFCEESFSPEPEGKKAAGNEIPNMGCIAAITGFVQAASEVAFSAGHIEGMLLYTAAAPCGLLSKALHALFKPSLRIFLQYP